MAEPTPQEQEEDSLTIMSYNIRYNNPGDGVNAWPNRKAHVGGLIGDQYGPDIIGLQEALEGQILDLQEQLPSYSWVGVGRSDGKNGGEYSPVFYNTERLELVATNTFWLSESPAIPGSKSWDAAITRVVTWAEFADRQTNQTFYLFNTHFDHRGEQARLESARLLVEQAGQIAGDHPFIITGDFNAGDQSDPYKAITNNEKIEDAFNASEAKPQGPGATFTNWEEIPSGSQRIDYIFIKKGIRVLNHQIIDDTYEGYFPSDHLPVLSEVVLATS